MGPSKKVKDTLEEKARRGSLPISKTIQPAFLATARLKSFLKPDRRLSWNLALLSSARETSARTSVEIHW
jgi:hypothetical protein